MREILDQMAELTLVDAEIAKLEEQLELYPSMIKKMDLAEKKLATAIDKASQGHKESAEQRRRSEVDVKALREKIAKFEKQKALIKTNKELEAINHEIEAANEKIDEHEMIGLEALEAEEKFETELEKLTAEQAKLLDHNNPERERISEQISVKKARLTEFESEHELRVKRLPDDQQEYYELLNGKHPGSALAGVDGQTCKGCGRTLTAQIARDARLGQVMARCESCGRILFDPND